MDTYSTYRCRLSDTGGRCDRPLYQSNQRTACAWSIPLLQAFSSLSNPARLDLAVGELPQ